MSMTRILFFTLVVPTLWFGVHVYIGRRLLERGLWRKATRQAGWATLLGLGLVTLLTQIGGRLGLEEALGGWMDPLYWVSYVYMGFFCLLLFAVLASELARLVPRLGASEVGLTEGVAIPGDKDDGREVDEGRRSFLRGLNMSVVGAAGGLTALGVHNARRKLDVVDVEVPIKDLPEALEGFRIVQISDLHIGPTIRRPFVERVVEVANGLGGDLIAVTGDLVDGNVAQRRGDVAPLKQLKAREGVFYVTGNHEYYWGVGQWLDEVKRLGFTALNNAHVVLERGGAKLAVAGVTDLKGGQFDPSHASDPRKAIDGAPQEAVKVLLAHRPRSAFEAVKAGFDLQLSGHTHGGQFAPWSLLVWMAQPFLAGFHVLDGMAVYVSRGTGYWGPPVRLAADPEITRLTLVRG